MKRQHKFYILNPNKVTFEEPSGHYFKPKRFKILANFAWRFLHKINAIQPHYTTVNTYTFGQKEFDNLHNYLVGMLDDIPYNRMDDFVFIAGEDVFHEIMSSQILHDRLSQRFTVNYEAKMSKVDTYYNPDSIRTSIFTIPVHFCPGVSGLALVEKIILEKKK